MNDRANDYRADAGFTLLEIIIAVAIFAMISVALASGISFSVRAWRTQERRIDQLTDLSAVQDVVRRLLTVGRNFKGGTEDLSFIGELPPALAGPGTFEIRLTTLDGRLMALWRRDLKSDPPAEFTETELARGINGLEISYYVIDPTTKLPAWADSAGDLQHPPKLIKFGVDLTEGTGRNWPPLVVAPLIEISPGR